MARKRALDYEQKESIILETATQLFSREGVERTSMSRIANASGNSKAVLYHYYESKELLLYQIVSRHMQDLVETARTARQSVDDPRQQLQHMIFAVLHAYQMNEDEHRIQLAGLPSLSNSRHEAIVDLQRQLVEEFAIVVRKMLPEHEHTRLLKPITMSLFGILNWQYTWFRDDGAMNLESYANMITELFLDGLGSLTQV